MKMTNNEVQAKGKYLRLSPFKVRRVLNQIRGQKYSDAILILEFMPYRPCSIVKEILESAAANAKNKYGWENNNLIISKAFADEGPTLKRFQPRAQGRAFPIHKPTCHITIELQNP